MPIDRQQALGAELAGVATPWSESQVMLYHLGIGAGDPCTDPGELAYTYENGLKVLPSFAVIPAFPFLMQSGSVKGLDFNPMMALHGEQEILLHGPIPTSAQATTSGRIAEIYDKGKAALIVVETETRDADGTALFTNRFSLFLRDEGGFQGPSGPKASDEPPTREADLVVRSTTLPQQGLLYRLSGDWNPLHADPAFAQMAGFERPILHGLCTYGMVCKAVVDHLLDGDTSAVAGFRARFRGIVLPGETIVTSMWRENGQVLVSAMSHERQTPVLSNAVITLRG
jgi:acyl dehydratase